MTAVAKPQLSHAIYQSELAVHIMRSDGNVKLVNKDFVVSQVLEEILKEVGKMLYLCLYVVEMRVQMEGSLV